MTITGLPIGTEWVMVEFNDHDYAPLSTNGGHGAIGYPVTGDTIKLRSIPANKDKLRNGAFVREPARAKGVFASDGYLPPCSGGRGHRYFADVHAMRGTKIKLKTIRVELGNY